jgi:hypothetical protein
VHLGKPRNLHPRQQRLPGIWHARGVPQLEPDMQRDCGIGGVHVQHEPRLHRGRECVRQRLDPRQVRRGLSGMLVRSLFANVYERRLQCGSLLHERVRERYDAVLWRGHPDVHYAIEWMHGMVLRRLGVREQRLYERRVFRFYDDGGKLPGGDRAGAEQLRSGERELLYERRGPLGHLQPNLHE